MSGENFGANMKARRLQLGFTLRDVEAIIENALSNGYLSQLENGKIKNPSAHVVLILCAAYSVSYEEALSWLQIERKIIPPKICGECGQAVPISKLVVIDNGKRCFTHCGDNCDCDAQAALAAWKGTGHEG